MDAEIAARDLADTFRYNVLPEVIEAIGWKKKELDFEDLPDLERLLWMVCAEPPLIDLPAEAFSVVSSTSRAKLCCSIQLYTGWRHCDKLFDGFAVLGVI